MTTKDVPDPGSEGRIIVNLQRLDCKGHELEYQGYFDGLSHGLGLMEAYRLQTMARGEEWK